MEQAGVKCSDRFGLQRQCARRPTAGADDQYMLHEIEVDLKCAGLVRNRRGSEAASGDVQRRVPRVNLPWRLRQSDLADDLRPEMERLASGLPVAIGELGPLAVAHPTFVVRSTLHRLSLLLSPCTDITPGMARSTGNPPFDHSDPLRRIRSCPL